MPIAIMTAGSVLLNGLSSDVTFRLLRGELVSQTTQIQPAYPQIRAIFQTGEI